METLLYSFQPDSPAAVLTRVRRRGSPSRRLLRVSAPLPIGAPDRAGAAPRHRSPESPASGSAPREERHTPSLRVQGASYARPGQWDREGGVGGVGEVSPPPGRSAEDRANLTPRTPGCGRPGLDPTTVTGLELSARPRRTRKARRGRSPLRNRSARPALQPGTSAPHVREPHGRPRTSMRYLRPLSAGLRFAPPPPSCSERLRVAVPPRARAPPTISGSRATNHSPPPRSQKKAPPPAPASQPARGRGPALSASGQVRPPQADPPEHMVSFKELLHFKTFLSDYM